MRCPGAFHLCDEDFFLVVGLEGVFGAARDSDLRAVFLDALDGLEGLEECAADGVFVVAEEVLRR